MRPSVSAGRSTGGKGGNGSNKLSLEISEAKGLEVPPSEDIHQVHVRELRQGAHTRVVRGSANVANVVLSFAESDCRLISYCNVSRTRNSIVAHVTPVKSLTSLTSLATTTPGLLPDRQVQMERRP